MKPADIVREIEQFHIVVGVNPPGDRQSIAMFGTVQHATEFEGIAGMMLPGIGFMALVAADEQGADRLRALARLLMQAPDYDGRELRLLRFTRAEVVEVIR